MTLKIKLTLDGIKIVDYDILPDNIKDAITKIVKYGKYTILNNTIISNWDEETIDILYMLNAHFDLFIMIRGYDYV